MKIIVTGSLGNISKPLAENLIQKGHHVVVISSNPEKQQAIEVLGATAAIGSLQDDAFLTSVFTGADAVYTMIPPDFTAPDAIEHYKMIGNNYAAAIRASGIERVVCLSSWGAHLEQGTGFIVGSYEVEQIFNNLSDIAITYLRPCSFYYNLYHYIDMIKHAGFIGTNFGGEDKVVMVSPYDIALAAAEALETSTKEKTIQYVASDEYTCNEIANILGEAIGKPDLKWIRFTDEETHAAMMQNGLPANVADKMVELNAAIHNGIMREDYDLHVPVFGKVKLQDFAKDFATAYNQK